VPCSALICLYCRRSYHRPQTSLQSSKVGQALAAEPCGPQHAPCGRPHQLPQFKYRRPACVPWLPTLRAVPLPVASLLLPTCDTAELGVFRGGITPGTTWLLPNNEAAALLPQDLQLPVRAPACGRQPGGGLEADLGRVSWPISCYSRVLCLSLSCGGQTWSTCLLTALHPSPVQFKLDTLASAMPALGPEVKWRVRASCGIASKARIAP